MGITLDGRRSIWVPFSQVQVNNLVEANVTIPGTVKQIKGKELCPSRRQGLNQW